ncbi:cytosine deaminase [Acuticoccus mangrovi]|uniref:Amidohydrolase family protein n=1 Tax=Acuticoccus mangrovi TaxID=2796142 RepID=A0A934IK26_9HYPH|nr:cytosine deaminase [Acuticoccus mangrovi]MBJ3776431.1 amidohydrolase family protein [Acuticoccus mangrovi]
MLDLLITNATLPDGRTGMTIAVLNGQIEAIVEGPLDTPAETTIDAGGNLVSPPLVDAHFHLDATLALGTGGKYNESGTLAEGIRLWGEIRPLLSADDFKRRALDYCGLAIAQGMGAIRTHVDVTPDDLLAVEVLSEVKREVADLIDIQMVAFPQMGYFSKPEMADNMTRALDMGVEVVGGIPHLEPTYELGQESIRVLTKIATERGLMVDLHCDENDDPNSRLIETLTYETTRLGLRGKVTGSHLTSMHSMDNFYANRLIVMMAKAGIHVASNPLANMFLQGRFDTYPKRRGLTRIPELIAAGCRVAMGHDSVLDPWYPLGRGDMLDVAFMAVHASHMSSRTEMPVVFDCVSGAAAEIMGLESYGLEDGCRADFVIHQAADTIEAIRLRLPRLAVIRTGKVIAQNAPTVTSLSFGDPVEIAAVGRPAH